MSMIERDGDDFVVPATILAEAYGLSEDKIRREMREGTITSRSERGVNADAGRWRLTFHRGGRAYRLIVDNAGSILTRASFPITARGLEIRPGQKEYAETGD